MSARAPAALDLEKLFAARVRRCALAPVGRCARRRPAEPAAPTATRLRGHRHVRLRQRRRTGRRAPRSGDPSPGPWAAVTRSPSCPATPPQGSPNRCAAPRTSRWWAVAERTRAAASRGPPTSGPRRPAPAGRRRGTDGRSDAVARVPSGLPHGRGPVPRPGPRTPLVTRGRSRSRTGHAARPGARGRHRVVRVTRDGDTFCPRQRRPSPPRGRERERDGRPGLTAPAAGTAGQPNMPSW